MINVSGGRLQDCYDGVPLHCWRIHDHPMRDVFTMASPPIDAPVAAAGYLQLATPEEQHAYLQACQTLTLNLANMESTLVICRQGVGRSPSIIFGVLRTAFGLSEHIADSVLLSLRPQAVITTITRSAAQWLIDQKLLGKSERKDNAR